MARCFLWVCGRKGTALEKVVVNKGEEEAARTHVREVPLKSSPFVRKSAVSKGETRIFVEEGGGWFFCFLRQKSSFLAAHTFYTFFPSVVGRCFPKKKTGRGVCKVCSYQKHIKRGKRRMEHPRHDWSGGNVRMCGDSGCNGRVYAKKLCSKCYAFERRKAAAKKTCTRDDCIRVPFRRTLCARHYIQFLREKNTTWSTCSVEHCCNRQEKASRYCAMHDSVYGVGVSKHTRQSLTPDAILRSVRETQKILEMANFPVLSLGPHQPV